MNILAVIPARIGSKSLPYKNIRYLAGKPLIAHTIIEARKSKYITRIVVSTDDNKIAAISKYYKAEVPFIRPKEISQDDSSSLLVLKHAVRCLKKEHNYKTDIVVCLFPTHPLRGVKEIDAVITKLIKTKAGSACTICEVDQHPYYMTEIKGDKTSFFKNKKTMVINRQNLPKLYILGGGIIAIWRNELMKKKLLFYAKDNRGVVINSIKCLDIHTKQDLHLAEIFKKYTNLTSIVS